MLLPMHINIKVNLQLQDKIRIELDKYHLEPQKLKMSLSSSCKKEGLMNSLTQNPYLFDTFDIDGDGSAKLNTSLLQYNSSEFYPKTEYVIETTNNFFFLFLSMRKKKWSNEHSTLIDMVWICLTDRNPNFKRLAKTIRVPPSIETWESSRIW